MINRWKCTGRSLFKYTHRRTPLLISTIYSDEQEQYVFHLHELRFWKVEYFLVYFCGWHRPMCLLYSHHILMSLQGQTRFSRSYLDNCIEKHFSRSGVHLNGKYRAILIKGYTSHLKQLHWCQCDTVLGLTGEKDIKIRHRKMHKKNDIRRHLCNHYD